MQTVTYVAFDYDEHRVISQAALLLPLAYSGTGVPDPSERAVLLLSLDDGQYDHQDLTSAAEAFTVLLDVVEAEQREAASEAASIRGSMLQLHSEKQRLRMYSEKPRLRMCELMADQREKQAAVVRRALDLVIKAAELARPAPVEDR